MSAILAGMARIDTRTIVDQLEDIIEMLEQMDGKDVSDVDPSKKIKSAAEISRDLLYIDHLLNRARVAVLDIYHDNRRAR